MRYFRKKSRKGECETAGSPSSPPPPSRTLTDLDYFDTFFLISTKTQKQKQSSLGSLSLLSNDDGDGNEKGKKAIGLVGKTTTVLHFVTRP